MRILAFALLICLQASATAAPARTWQFRVLLDEREIGWHRFTLADGVGEAVLMSEARFRVRVLFIDAYRYDHRARERWSDGCLREIAARTETNGALEIVNARTQGPRLMVERPSGRGEYEGCVMSFAYWNPAILKAERLLNAQTGEVLPVKFTSLGREPVAVGGRALTASRHLLSAPGLAIDLWYADGDWVALETTAAGGSRLRYERI
jgi:hypothetical protein